MVTLIKYQEISQEKNTTWQLSTIDVAAINYIAS